MNAAEAPAVPAARPGPAVGWGRRAVVPAMLIVLVAAVATWLNVVKTIRDPDPLAIPERPPIAGIVWSNRVFVHEKALKRWLETRGYSYAAWARAHPRAVAVLRDRPQRRQLAAPSTRAQRAAAPVAPDDIGLAALTFLVAGILGAIALFAVAARRALLVALDRSPGLPRIDARLFGRRVGAASEGIARALTLLLSAVPAAVALLVMAARGVAGPVLAGSSKLPRPAARHSEALARTARRAVHAARAGLQALLERLRERWADGLPSVHRRPPAAETPPVIHQSQEPNGPDAPIRISSWVDVAPAGRVGDAPAANWMRRFYDTLEDAAEAFRDYRFRVAVWVLTGVIAAAGLTFLIAHATQP